ncbi:unnamed protein product, partial [Prorocentrum cordatum]
PRPPNLSAPARLLPASRARLRTAAAAVPEPASGGGLRCPQGMPPEPSGGEATADGGEGGAIAEDSAPSAGGTADVKGALDVAMAADADGLTVLHVSCRDFNKMTGQKVQKWLSCKSQATLHKVFKLPKWMYAFVSVSPDQAEQFRKEVGGVMYSKHTVTVKEGHPRDANSKMPQDKPEGEPAAKRQKVKDFPDGYVPTLKDLKDRVAKRKGPGQAGEESIIQKSAPLLSWPYETQLSMKGTYVKSAVRAFTKAVKKRCEDRGEDAPPWTSPEWSHNAGAPVGCGCPLDDAIGTPAAALQGYRNKCEFTIGNTADGQAEVGFVLRAAADGDQVIASPEEIPHVPEVMKRMCAALRACVRRSGLPVFDRRRGVKAGVWRTVMARLSPTGDMLLLVQTATLAEETRQKVERLLLEDLRPEGCPDQFGVVSIYLQFNDEVTDAARPDVPLLHVHGQQRLQMPLLGLKFDLGPLSFFQANSATCESLYGKAIEWLRPSGALMLDVCCGVGTIGLCAASQSLRVIGVELVPEAVESARRNARLNGIENAEFIAGKAPQSAAPHSCARALVSSREVHSVESS